MTLEYTYDTYVSDYTIDGDVIPYLRGDEAHTQLHNLATELMRRIGLFDDTTRPGNVGAILAIYVTSETIYHAAFFFIKGDDEQLKENVSIYRMECKLVLVNGIVQVAGCKTYVTPSHFARNNVNVVHLKQEETVLLVGVCGVVTDTKTPILLSGLSYDVDNGAIASSSYLITPPKSFFVEGEHEDFAPVGKYPLALCDEC